MDSSDETLPSPDQWAKARVGRVLKEKWRIERLLGVGGMASVFAARHRNGDRVAVKILHPELSVLPDVRRRFLREGYAANTVGMPAPCASTTTT